MEINAEEITQENNMELRHKGPVITLVLTVDIWPPSVPRLTPRIIAWLTQFEEML